MQVALPRGPAVPSPAEAKRSAPAFVRAWIDAVPMFARQPDASEWREQTERQDQTEKQGQRDQQRQALATDAATAEQPADVLRKAERDIDPSSRTFARQAAREQIDQRYAQDRQSFRQTLRDARVQPPAPPARVELGADPAQEISHETSGATADASSHDDPPGRAPQSLNANPRPAPATPVCSTQPPNPQPTSAQSATPATATMESTLAASAAPSSATAQASMATASAAVIEGASSATGAAVGNQPQSGQPTAPTSTSSVAATRETVRSVTVNDKAPAADRGAEPADPSENIDKILRVLRQQIGRERSTTIMRIDPPHLGSLRLQMDLRKEAMSLRIDTQTPLAHRLLSDEIDRLRAGLEATGIQLTRVEIVPPPVLDAAQRQPPQDQGRRRAGRSKGDAGTDARTTSPESDERSRAAPISAAEPRVNLVA